MKKFIRTAAVLASVAGVFLACNNENQIIQDENRLVPDAGGVQDIMYITATIGDGDNEAEPETKTSHVMQGSSLKTYWSAGDVISVVPGQGLYSYAGTYRATASGSSSVFEQVSPVQYNLTPYGVFYPGDRIKSIIEYTKFSYEGQQQRKDDPMAHLASYHTMWAKTDDFTRISFASADQSSCLRLTLSGRTFHNPVRIEVSVLGNECFWENNSINDVYTHFKGDDAKPLTHASSLSLALSGYGEESALEAWIAMSNNDVTLNSGDDVLIKVYEAGGTHYSACVRVYEQTTLRGGKWHNLTITKGWVEGDSDFGHYDWDGSVVNLQNGIEGVDLILMGDGFIKEDFDNGTYDAIMRQAYEEFFAVEPLKSLKSGFNVCYVRTPSRYRVDATNTGSNGASNNSTRTRFSSQFTPNTTSISGNTDLARQYALNALGNNAAERIKDATIVVMVNQECRAGTCSNSWVVGNPYDYGQACSVAYCALGRNDNERRNLMKHEICGHGFGKLGDEYGGADPPLNTGGWIQLDNKHELGLYRNIDKHIEGWVAEQLSAPYNVVTTAQNVLWHDMFGTANNYESAGVEALGVYKGANTYSSFYCRPTEDGRKSIMNSDGEYFNAISRRQMYYRYMRLSGALTTNCFGSPEELAGFLAFDAEHCLPTIVRSGAAAAQTGACVLKDSEAPEVLVHTPPVWVAGHWENGIFIPEK